MTTVQLPIKRYQAALRDRPNGKRWPWQVLDLDRPYGQMVIRSTLSQAEAAAIVAKLNKEPGR
jgi:hypothetical protein